MLKNKRLRIQNSELGLNKIIIDGVEYSKCPHCDGKYLDVEIITHRRLCWDTLMGVRADLELYIKYILMCSNSGCKKMIARFHETKYEWVNVEDDIT